MPRSALLYAKPLPENVFLVQAAAVEAGRAPDWSDTLHATLADLKRRDAERRAALQRRASQAIPGE